MSTRNEGLTKTYNRFHNPKERAPDIQTLRALQIELDEVVATAYGWPDLVFHHDFNETKQGVRFTYSDSVRREVLDRLLALNHERYAKEVERGLHDKKPQRVESHPHHGHRVGSRLGSEDELRKRRSRQHCHKGAVAKDTSQAEEHMQLELRLEVDGGRTK